jgi:hypothetical protein
MNYSKNFLCHFYIGQDNPAAKLLKVYFLNVRVILVNTNPINCQKIKNVF